MSNMESKRKNILISRQIENKAIHLSSQFPVLSLLGPRQSGKTTLAKLVCPKHNYVTLEDLDNKKKAIDDPRGFLKENINEYGIIIDEVQHAPDLLSYIQTYVDHSEKPGEIVITGSQNILVNEKITQSLAGRVGILTLLPLSIAELKSERLLADNSSEVMFNGFYPRVHARQNDPYDFYSAYIHTYIERDVRQLKNITDLKQFQTFMKLCAGRCGQLLNIANLSNETGLSASCIKGWLSVLEATYIIFLLPSYHKNYRKRLIKAPKLYFYDIGIACHLLGIQSPHDIPQHFLRGGLFESMVLADLQKHYLNQGKRPSLYFWQDKTGNEVDCIIEKGLQPTPLEIKSTQTIYEHCFEGLSKWCKLAEYDQSKAYLIYGGDQNQKWKKGQVVSWRDIDSIEV